RSVSMDFVDHFRGEDSDFDYTWEERWIRDEGYAKIVPPAIKAALADANLKGADINHFIMPALMAAIPKQMAKMAGVADAAECDKKTAQSVLWRKRDMIYGLVGGKCRVCGTAQFPRTQVCVNPNCHAMDSQDPYPMQGLEAAVMSFTADSLTYSPDPPAYYG